MTHRLSPNHRWLAVPALVVLLLFAAGFVIEADSRTEQPTRVLVVVDTAGDTDPALVRSATDALAAAERAGADAELRVTRTPTEQLSVTHYFAAKGFDTVVGVGLDPAIAVDPVAERFPGTRFTAATEQDLAAAAESAAR
jgi:hypothetical protein